MPSYAAPLRDMRFVLFDLLGVETELQAMPAYADIGRDSIDAVFEEAARFAAQVVQPLNAPGDIVGCSIDADGNVATPPGFADAYRRFGEDGWAALGCHPDFGGQGLPTVVNNSVYEMFNAANQAWFMYSSLSHAAYHCLSVHGSDEQKRVYLPRLSSGRWSGTMCLTEAQCGTDLGLIRTRAEPSGDGEYLLTGTKIFISAGEHDCSENIVHLVLARLPDAPAGTRGISLFLVPKFLPDADGEPGERNGVRAGSIEHKMGIHGNATCVLDFDRARAWLIGEPHKGLAAMFVMMNTSRIGVGLQSLGQADVALQNAVAYARDRLQGRAAHGVEHPDKPADPILAHADVRRMLLTARAYTEGARAMAGWIALLSDRLHAHPDAQARSDANELVALLTPVFKAFATDNAFETCNLCLQVFGGHGFIREWGMEQHVRDARINMIYEGTNGIQALDLLGRKVLHDRGARLGLLLREVQGFVAANAGDARMGEFLAPLGHLARDVQAISMELGAAAAADADAIGAAATAYLRLLGHLVFAWMWARMAELALDAAAPDAFLRAKLATARFYYARLLPETGLLMAQIRSGPGLLMAFEAEAF